MDARRTPSSSEGGVFCYLEQAIPRLGFKFFSFLKPSKTPIRPEAGGGLLLS
ncbi:hypothetical protein KHQ84_gp020 [Rhodococcus phage Finch]|uniref:Uncharacterized protein n=1 Tax=Rhodococcus phage Finch TaxID=2094144 RepID=A0A2P1JXR0_9CAUD|nr:hypothetical protein KHQ84_gp020 [Rhodococcus phage Finch]AVO25151.1 hypothetical protein SEA_FINCH_20 [Rhodococcus phage Finch]